MHLNLQKNVKICFCDFNKVSITRKTLLQEIFDQTIKFVITTGFLPNDKFWHFYGLITLECTTASVWKLLCGRLINFWKAGEFWFYWFLVALFRLNAKYKSFCMFEWFEALSTSFCWRAIHEYVGAILSKRLYARAQWRVWKLKYNLIYCSDTGRNRVFNSMVVPLIFVAS